MTDDTAHPDKPPKAVPLRVVAGGEAAAPWVGRAERAGGADAVRAAVAGAEPYVPPPAEAEADGRKPRDPFRGDWRAAKWPVTPLGKADNTYFYLDAIGELRALHFREHTRLGLMSLWGDQAERLEELWPRVRKADKETIGFEADACAREHMAACAARGVWKPLEKLRGPGAWLGTAGNLILHLGDHVWVGAAPGEAGGQAERLDPGLIDGYIYPAAQPGPHPSAQAWGCGPKGPAEMFLSILKTWSFRRGELDAWLMMCWNAAAMVGGALDWRPNGWVTGGAGTGKSTLQDVCKAVQGGTLVAVHDPTAAGIRQVLGHSSYPAWTDEAEAKEDGRQLDAVVELARAASSGARVPRGGQNHEASDFILRGAFMFSSIDMPPLAVQDLQRFVIFALDPLPDDAAPFTLDKEALRELGRRLLRRMMDGWDRFRPTLDIYKTALAAAGHTSRGAAQFGTLLACGDLLAQDHLPDSDSVEAWVSKLRPADVAEIQDALAGERLCVKWALGSPVDPFRSGGRKPLGEWMAQAAGLVSRAEGREEANRVIGLYGLKFKLVEGAAGFVIANNHRGLAEIYEKSRWAARPHAASAGWVQQWRRLEGARWGNGVGERKGYNVTVDFAGDPGKGTWVPLEAVFPDGYSADAQPVLGQAHGDFELRER